MTGRELTLNEMEKIVGGTGGSRRPLPERNGLYVYQIQRGDTLGKIARRFNTDAEYLKSINHTIDNINDITPGYYIYVPQ